MPTYEYACTECGRHLEVVQSFSDDPLTTCPTCGAPLRKVFGNIGIVLKGSGFYKTDSRTPQKESKAGGDRSDSKPDTAAPATKDTPAAKDGSSPSGNGSGSSGKPGSGSKTAEKSGASSGAGASPGSAAKTA